MPLSVGTRLGPYEILAPIGSGGMGDVYRARDTRLDRIVAVKVSKEQFSERFGHEARAVAALNDPNICQLYDVGPNYLVMEYVEGVPLKGPFPLEQANISSVRVKGSAENLGFAQPEPLFSATFPMGTDSGAHPLAVNRDGSRIYFLQSSEQPDSGVIKVRTGAIR
jgi:hypothetical protein